MRKKASQAARPAAEPARLPWFRTESFILGALLAIATLAVYWPVSHCSFFNFDDPVYVANNPHIVSGLDWDTVAWAFTTFHASNWHPMTWLSHALDVQLFQLAPGGHHVMNLLLATVNVLLLFWLLVRATGYVGCSAMVAGLFALHPVNVESVAWIAERKNLLSMFFFLLGMLAYHWYASSRQRPPKLGRYAVMTACFTLGLMSKPQTITFPFILLLWDYWPLERMAVGSWRFAFGFSPFALHQKGADVSSGERETANSEERSFLWLVKEKIPLFVICAASAAVTVVAQRAGGSVASLRNYPLSVRFSNAIVSYLRYIGKALWPTNLAPLYPHPWQPLPMWQVIPSLLALLAITALMIAARRRRYLLVGWLWFLGTLVPMIGIVHVGNQAMADRYAYLPYIGLFIMICWSVAELAASRKVPVVIVRAFSVIVLLALAMVTHRQLSYWSDSVKLWTHTLQVTNDNYIAHDNLALPLMQQGRTEEAIQHYQAALAIYADDPSANLALAMYAHQHGRLQEAIARYEQMIRITPAGPARAQQFTSEGLVYLDMHDVGDAQKDFQQAVEMDPQNIRGWLGLGVVAEQTGDLRAAIDDYQRANTTHPMRVTYLLLAKALDEAGDAAGAQAARDRAKLLPGDEKMTQTYSGGILQK